MIYSNPSVENNIREFMINVPELLVADLDHEKDIHEISESISMELGPKIQVSYSRKPSLQKSFSEANQKPLIIIDKNKTFMGVVSETNILKNGQSDIAYYTSDLRISQSATIQVRKEFRSLYSTIISFIDKNCYTTVFKENIKAINSLTSKRFSVFYNFMFEYITETYVVLPGLNFTRYKTKEISKEQFQKQSENFLEKSEFCHSLTNSNYYLLMEKNKIVAAFTFKKAQNRSLIIHSKSLWINFLLKIINFRKKNDHQLSWAYIGHFIPFKKENNNLMNSIIKNLRKDKVIGLGDLLVTAKKYHSCSSSKNFGSGCPVFQQNVYMYQVEQTNCERFVHGTVILDPSQL